MNHCLKMTLAVAALHLFAAHAAAAGGDAARDAPAPAFAAKAVRAEGGRRAAMSQKGGTRARRGRAVDALTPGVWGGEHIRFEVTGRGARIEYDCAHGTVEGRIVVDGRGRFGVEGTHYEERGGPVRAGEGSAGYRVRLSGRVGGSLMRLTVTRADNRELIGTFSLARGREPELVKCR